MVVVFVRVRECLGRLLSPHRTSERLGPDRPGSRLLVASYFRPRIRDRLRPYHPVQVRSAGMATLSLCPFNHF